MAVSRALRRLLRVLELEEEQSQLALKSALGELRSLEHRRMVTRAQEREGRHCIVRSAYTGDVSDRLAGLQQSQSAAERVEAIERKMAEVGFLVGELRRVYLAKRVERRQAGRLIQETEARDAEVAARRTQQELDDWYLNRMLAKKGVAPRDEKNLPNEGGKICDDQL
jgi:hypothetical protein